MKKVLFLLMFPYLATLLVGCCICTDHPVNPYYHCSTRVQNLDNSREYLINTSLNKIDKDAFGLRIIVDLNGAMCINHSGSFFFPSAHAYSCDCPGIETRALDEITAITITTLRDFDDEHLAGSDVTDYFQVFTNNTLQSLASYITTFEPTFENASFARRSADALLMTPPTLGAEQKFKIQVEISDGKILEVETDKLELI